MGTDSRDPSGLVWLIGLVSLVLPWIGVPLAMVGVVHVVRGDSHGWLLVAGGLLLIVLDVLIDVVWAHPEISRSDETNLNSRGAQCVGRVAEVVLAITHGEGKVRVGGTLWTANGPDHAAGALVRVVGVEGTRLIVEPVDTAAPLPTKS